MQSVKQNLLAAFRYLLKPLVRLAIKNAVKASEFTEVLREAYVDVAARQLRASGANVTDEGVALITGMELSDVRVSMGSGVADNFGAEAQESNPLPTVLEKWHTDPDYLGPYGVVRDLALSRVGNAALSFSDLATKYCPGASPKVLMDELRRTGCVQDVGNGFFRPLKRLYVPDPLSTQSVLWFARVVHNLCDTLERNLSEKARGGVLVERTIYAVHGVTKQNFEAFDKFLKGRVQLYANEIDDFLSARDEQGLGDGIKTGVGIYQYIVNEEDERALSKELTH
jgi:hypothetical protein